MCFIKPGFHMIVPIAPSFKKVSRRSLQLGQLLFAIVWVVIPYDCPYRLNIIWDDRYDQDNLDYHMETKLKV